MPTEHESYKSRVKRSTEAAKQAEKADKYRYKALMAKTDEKHDKLNAKADSYGKNVRRLREGLSENEIRLGREKHNINKASTQAAIVGTLIGGGTVPSYLATQVFNKAFSKSYKEASRAAKADYEKYLNTPLSELYTDKKEE